MIWIWLISGVRKWVCLGLEQLKNLCWLRTRVSMNMAGRTQSMNFLSASHFWPWTSLTASATRGMHYSVTWYFLFQQQKQSANNVHAKQFIAVECWSNYTTVGLRGARSFHSSMLHFWPPVILFIQTSVIISNGMQHNVTMLHYNGMHNAEQWNCSQVSRTGDTFIIHHILEQQGRSDVLK